MSEENQPKHREHVRKRLLAGGNESFLDQDIVEALLLSVVKRQDVKKRSRDLIDKFKDIRGILTASPDELRTIDGVGDSIVCVFKIVHEIANRFAKQSIKDGNVLNNMDDLIAYLRIKIGHEHNESFIVLFLDNSYRVLGEFDIQGTANQALVSPADITKKALNIGAVHAVIAHNHPSGEIQPSQPDKELTKKLKNIFQSLSINLIDHIIISSADFYSFKLNRLL
ncbi:MAG: DNA repair protein RadC [Alphaproteobacteria bacterium]|nr:DNA repair protein RadC [Alphaproteobacteria bacterium]